MDTHTHIHTHRTTTIPSLSRIPLAVHVVGIGTSTIDTIPRGIVSMLQLTLDNNKKSYSSNPRGENR